MNTMRVMKIGLAWTTIAWTVCYLLLGLIPGLSSAIAPYITHTIRRFGDWVLDLSPPEAAPVTALNLAPGALFPGPITPAPGSNLPVGSTPGRRGRR